MYYIVHQNYSYFTNSIGTYSYIGVNSRLFPVRLGRNESTPPVTIITYCFRLVHVHTYMHWSYTHANCEYYAPDRLYSIECIRSVRSSLIINKLLSHAKTTESTSMFVTQIHSL